MSRRTSPWMEHRLRQVLDVLAESPAPVSLEKIAARLGLSNRSSVQPYLAELAERGDVRRVEGWELAVADDSVSVRVAGHAPEQKADTRQGGVIAGDTVWRVQAIPGRPGLDLTLSVETTAPAVVEVIERAAREAGVQLVRIERVREDGPPGWEGRL